MFMPVTLATAVTKAPTAPIVGKSWSSVPGTNWETTRSPAAFARHCGAKIAGHFDDTPGDWGQRRMPVRIADFA